VQKMATGFMDDRLIHRRFSVQGLIRVGAD